MGGVRVGGVSNNLLATAEKSKDEKNISDKGFSLNHFKMLSPFVSSIIALNARRVMHNIGEKLYHKRRKVDIIVVDVDGTLLNGFIGYDIIVNKFGKEIAEKEEMEFRRRLREKRRTIEEEMALFVEECYKRGIEEKDIRDVIENYEKEGRIRTNLVSELQRLKKMGKKVFIITKGYEYIAKYLAEKYGFDCGFGLSIDSNGKVAEIIGTKKKKINGIYIKTKVDKLKEYCKAEGIKFNKKRVCLITDDIFDAVDMRKAGFSILVTPTEQTNLGEFQRAASKYGAYDIKIDERDLHKLREIIE